MATRRESKERARAERIAKEEAARRGQRNRRLLWFGALVVGAVVVGVALAIVSLGDSHMGTANTEFSHVHGLGVDPGDGALYVATHEGLYRSPSDSAEAQRVGDTDYDFMGFTLISPSLFLGSGHSGSMQGGHANLGLIRSTDGGESWTDVSLTGEADFHVLRAGGDTIYGIDSSTGALSVSEDGGQTWEERETPTEVIDLAVDPDDDQHVVASTAEGITQSTDAAATWRDVGRAAPGLLAWPSAQRLYRIDGSGIVSLSDDAGKTWRETGSIEGQPVAVTATDEDLYVALDDNTVQQSSDDGATWTTRAASMP